jgi:hypothetical protein
VWWIIPLVACSGALLYLWWSITAKRRQNTFKSMTEYETFRSAFERNGSESEKRLPREQDQGHDS